jgi:hypothetical protein
MGLASSFVSALVLALYVDTRSAELYVEPRVLWAVVPVILFWQCHLWLSTVRGHMHDDPIVYAARDRVSWACFLLIAIAFLGASFGLPFVQPA